ncbi:hypothetical protein [Sphaerobacter thermophilus]|jgi:hypothetical protein|uniref:Uncharacterized protein n=1 Tax=Sphaerobacter thermophilus (strain ATCC 49802 / DSM 20745 / KCCM 41009 / NCIMB 13125 / S 6022) TaxID=479434 RepID=D1C5S2_SPHTD|nr:hypothetical protein [Sphaerobacter thermophilus]ACZ39474.1 hypothetical protein Sthe_2044 [Sphaerobacter thermophilus DSM 20745]PZN65661.1 MAG: hypothetical protein DIU58_06880 [Sphaerobacter thermophilus]
MSGQAEKPSGGESTAVQPATESAPAVVEGHAVAGPPPQGGVSWEEARKGQAPKTIKNPDEALLYDRYTSQFTIVNMPGATWRPVRPLFKPD